jgi:hypothetical protein
MLQKSKYNCHATVVATLKIVMAEKIKLNQAFNA